MGKRNELEPGQYDKFVENFAPKNYYNINRKNNLIQKNIKDFAEEQKQLDYMQSFFVHEHKKDMNNLQKYRTDQFNCKKGTQDQNKFNRQEFARDVEIANDKINEMNEKKRKMLLRKDEVRQDGNNNEKQQKEFDYYKNFMHSGIDSGRNANLVKKYIKLSYND